MGPRPFSRGNGGADYLVDEILTWLQWGHDLSAVETTPCSMWQAIRPRLQWGHDLSAVETSKVKLEESRELLLQWGHDLSAVETRLRETRVS